MTTLIEGDGPLHVGQARSERWGAIEATEEAILNALVAAETMVGRDDITAHRLDHASLVEIMTRHGGGPG